VSVEEYIERLKALGIGDHDLYFKEKQPVYINQNVYCNGAQHFDREETYCNIDANPNISIKDEGDVVYLELCVDESMLRLSSSIVSTEILGVPRIFEENAKQTAKIVEYAHSKGVTVEAELGHVGNAMVGNEADTVSNEDPEDTLTIPEEVKEFAYITDVDALAVAIGTAHGVYKKTPTLRIDRLDEITAVCALPLVLHGGSGTSDEQLRCAIEHGVTKINIFSDVVGVMNSGLKHKLNNISNPSTWPVYVFEEACKNMKETVRDKIRVFGSNNRI